MTTQGKDEMSAHRLIARPTAGEMHDRVDGDGSGGMTHLRAADWHISGSLSVWAPVCPAVFRTWPVIGSWRPVSDRQSVGRQMRARASSPGHHRRGVPTSCLG